MMQLTFINWLLAFTPVLVVLVLMLALRWGGSRAGVTAWVITLLLGWLHFGASPRLLAYSQVKGILLTLDVLYIIWTALLLFQVAREAGAVDIIGNLLQNLTSDRTMQGLLLGWLFPSFLQGFGGFGVPVAVSAPLLMGVGFSPIQAVIMASLGHGWAVNFGSMATSYQSLLAVTNLPGELLAPDAAILMGISAYICGGLVAYIAGGWKGLRRTLFPVLALATIMAGVQYLLAVNGMWTVAATGAAMVGLAFGVLFARLPAFRSGYPEDKPINHAVSQNALPSTGKSKPLWLSLSAYVILVGLAFLLNLSEPIKEALSFAQIRLSFPELTTSLGWVTPAEEGRKISLFSHPGAILLYTSLSSMLVYGLTGYYKKGAVGRILRGVVNGAVGSSLGIAVMVGLSVVMSHTGMTNLLAEGLSRSFGKNIFPLVSPFIGALGAFITGSNNNSNVLFGVLQQRTAELLGLSVTAILAAQTTGGSLGSVFAPAKVIVGCSTVGLSGKEGLVMRKMILLGLLPIVVTALAAGIYVGFR